MVLPCGLTHLQGTAHFKQKMNGKSSWHKQYVQEGQRETLTCILPCT